MRRHYKGSEVTKDSVAPTATRTALGVLVGFVFLFIFSQSLVALGTNEGAPSPNTVTAPTTVVATTTSSDLDESAEVIQSGEVADESADIIPFEAINYYVVRHFNAYSLAATGFLNPEVSLPATVEIAVPAGSDIIWLSEFSGGPVTAEIEFTEPFNVRRQGNHDVYTVTLTQSNAVQIEYQIEDSPNMRLSEGIYSLVMEYTPIYDLPILRLMTNLPPESEIMSPDAEFMGADEEGYLVYFLKYTDVPANQTMQGEITYRPPEGAGMIATGGNLFAGLAIAVGVTAVAVAVGFVFYRAKGRNS